MAKRAKPNQLHDEFVKKQLSNKEAAQDFIRQFLPPDMVQKFDLTSIELDKTSYITPKLAKYFSDLVWLCRYKETQVRVAFLVEHKSSPVQHPHLQLLRYMLEVWERNLKDEKPLLLIVPIVFYHGDDKWQRRPMVEYFAGIDSSFEQYVPQFDYELIDLSEYEDKDIIEFKIGLLKNVLLALRYGRDADYMRENFGLFFIEIDDYIETELGKDFLQTMLVYLLKSSEFSDLEIDIMIGQIPSSLKNKIMTSYDYLVEALEERAEKRVTKRVEEVMGRVMEEVTGRVTEEVTEKVVKKGKNEVIRKARLKGATIEFIADIVELSTEKVRSILDELGIE